MVKLWKSKAFYYFQPNDMKCRKCEFNCINKFWFYNAQTTFLNISLQIWEIEDRVLFSIRWCYNAQTTFLSIPLQIWKIEDSVLFSFRNGSTSMHTLYLYIVQRSILSSNFSFNTATRNLKLTEKGENYVVLTRIVKNIR